MKNRSYSEFRRKKAFNWYKFLIKEKYTLEELDDATDKAANWVTCACGNQCSVIPRHMNGVPIDEKLTNLGIDFSENIIDLKRCQMYFVDDFERIAQAQKKALRTLNKIERRSFYLLCEIAERKSNAVANKRDF